MTEASNDSSIPQETPQDTQRREDLERMTALVQHALNNPLAALLAEAQLLGNGDDAGSGAPGSGGPNDGAGAPADRAGPRAGQQGQREDVPQVRAW